MGAQEKGDWIFRGGGSEEPCYAQFEQCTPTQLHFLLGEGASKEDWNAFRLMEVEDDTRLFCWESTRDDCDQWYLRHPTEVTWELRRIPEGVEEYDKLSDMWDALEGTTVYTDGNGEGWKACATTPVKFYVVHYDTGRYWKFTAPSFDVGVSVVERTICQGSEMVGGTIVGETQSIKRYRCKPAHQPHPGKVLCVEAPQDDNVRFPYGVDRLISEPSLRQAWLSYNAEEAKVEKAETSGQKLLATLKADGTEAGWRVAGSQLVKLTREPLVALLSRHLGPDDEALRGRIAAFLETELGTAILTSALSMGLTNIPGNNATAQQLGRELRVRALASGGDMLVDLVAEPLRQVAAQYLQGDAAAALSVRGAHLPEGDSVKQPPLRAVASVKG